MERIAVRVPVSLLVLLACGLACTSLAQESAWRHALWTDPATGETLASVQARSTGPTPAIGVIACGADGRPVLAFAARAFQDVPAGEPTVATSLDDGDPQTGWGAWRREAAGAVLRWAGDDETLASFLGELSTARTLTVSLQDASGADLAAVDLAVGDVDVALAGLACFGGSP
jgi:hypothetical protein